MSAPAGSVVLVEHLQKRYGELVAVDDVSFEVHRGEIFGILGPNGSGKTTTIECLQGLRRADEGTLEVLGFDPQREADELRRHIGAQLQESALPDRIKVCEAMDLFSSLQPDGPPWRAVMEDWGLAGKERSAFSSLSGGQRQRLFVALALVNAPQVVFLDEMTTGLDPASRRVAWSLLEQLREAGTTVVLVTHFMDEAEHLCDRVCIIDAGRVTATGSPAALVDELSDGVAVTFSTARDVSFLDDVEGVTSRSRTGTSCRLTGRGPLLARVAAALVAQGIEPLDLQVERASLEDVYLRLTRASDEGGHVGEGVG